MILDVEQFIQKERPAWNELEGHLQQLRLHGSGALTLDEAKRLHYLYQRTVTDLAKVRTHTTDEALEQYLEQLIAQAYGDLHEVRTSPLRFHPVDAFLLGFPRAVRLHARAFALSLGVTLLGTLLGMIIFALEPASKQVMPFGHGLNSPSDRVAKEEQGERIEELEANMGVFSAQLMVNNIRVSIMTMCAGITFGLGTVLLLFMNGMILGLISLDYILDGQTVFLLGWLLPHGAIEIPAIVLAGQAGLVLGNALVGFGTREPIRARMRRTIPSLMLLIYGVAVMLVWAGLIEAFFSQYHEPVLPYALKIAFGCIEMVALVWFLTRSGREDLGARATGPAGGVPS
ncbi:MAG: stage II sporulation protein M [Candidatus Hydrogenedentes bacterium]|nr:stage II sporulation protein M [Candidatus Hydrogenedentota bacterium]